MKLKTTPAPAHAIAFRDALVALLRDHTGACPADVMLSSAAYVVGQLVAFQDQRVMTPDQAMQIVEANIVAGNRDACQRVQSETGRIN